MPPRLTDLPPLEDLETGSLPPLEEEETETPIQRRHRAGQGKRRNRRAGPSSTYSSANNPRANGLRKIHAFIEDACLQVALPPSPMGIVLPVTSTVFISQGPAFADRVVALAEADQRVFNALLRASKYGAYLGLASIASTISVAVMVDLGTINRESFIAQRVVGGEIEQVYGARQSSNGSPAPVPAPAGWPSASG